MEILDILKLAGFVLLIGFVVFAFRQGRKVKPDDRRESFPPGDGSP